MLFLEKPGKFRQPLGGVGLHGRVTLIEFSAALLHCFVSQAGDLQQHCSHSK